ncbi:MAG: hypothetical protein AAB871_03480 [Patescibacteria group bacterium]
MKKSKRKEIAKSILKGVGLATMVGSVIVFPGLAPMYKWIEDISRERSPKARYSLNRMKKRGLIRIVLQDSRVKMFLTLKGKKSFKNYQFEDLAISKPSSWDGLWRLVMFDVPESSREARDLIRRKLSQLGFVSIQKSVYIHPYPCESAIEVLKQRYKLGTGEIYVFDSKVREGEAVLKRHFRL